jgi:hypothetical protein
MRMSIADQPLRTDRIDGPSEPASGSAATPPTSGRWARARTVATWVMTVLAALLVWFALVAPDRLDRLGPGAFVRIPIEGLVIVALSVLLPPRARRTLAIVVGLALGLLTVVKILNMGFFAELDRPFNPVTDWSFFGPAAGVLRDSIGQTWTVVAEILAVVLVIALLVLVPLSVLRLTRLTARHRAASVRTIGALGLVWILCAVLGVKIVSGLPIASTSAAGLAYDQAQEVRHGLKDQQVFAATLAAHDPLRGTPSADLLTGLRGKDVIVAFVESYGRIAVQGSAFSPQVDAVLNAGTNSLSKAGFSSRSAFLTSPTFGGISWLAHSTLQSGLWIDNQGRYNQLVASDRFTLSDAFKRAGWRTVSDIPSNEGDWAQGTSFYNYDKLYNGSNVGYIGPKFSYAAMPDQYTLAAFQRLELAKPNHTPVMAEIDLVSSHTPWAPLPRMVDWNKVGDGSVFDGMPAQGQSAAAVWRDPNQVRAAYGQSIQYSLTALISFVQTFHDNNLVLVLLGDHQPATTVSGTGGNHDVPISIVAHDPNVLDRISSWGWQDGMLPNPQAPVWGMDAFRNRFLTAFGPHPPTALPGAPVNTSSGPR